MSGEVWGELRGWFTDARKVIIAGIGNPIRSDDYVGLKIVGNLKGKVLNNVLLLECETVPESYVSDIQEFRPTHVLLIDAAFLNLRQGEIRLVQPKEIASYPALTTHMLPLRIFCDLIESSAGAKVALLLIQPGNVAFGESLTIGVKKTAEKVTALLLELFGNKKD